MAGNTVEVRRGASVPHQPRVGVIIPAYNVSQYIKEALDSVFAQTFRDYEVVVVNDGSPDTKQLEKVLNPYSDRITYAHQENRGPSSARNTGLRLTQAPFVALLDADDAWLPEYLSVQMAIMEDDLTIDVLYPNSIIFGNTADAGRTHMDLNPSRGEVTFESLVLQKCSVMVSVVARRDVIMRAGLFDEELRGSEDFDLWLRILNQRGRIAYHRRVLVRYRRRPDSLSSDSNWMYGHTVRVLQKAAKTLELTHSEGDALQKGLASFRAQQLLCDGKEALSAGDMAMAIRKFEESNRLSRRRKLDLLIPLLRIAPGLFLHLYQARQRFNLNPSDRN